jgi:uncharacterized protein (DUF2236 family)
MASSRPIDIPNGDQPKDDGLFGPDSVTWRLMASPSAAVGGATAVLMQMLHPRVMRMIDQASNVREDPEERGRLTAEYINTISYGDTEAAERAGEVLRRIHAHRRAVDPISGETYTPNEPDLLMWVHCTLVWGILAACERWGPALSIGERDRFVDEQRVSARLVGLDAETAPGTTAALDAYMTSMLPHLAYVTETKLMREMMVPPRLPFTPEGLVQLVMTRAAVDLLTPPMRDLYGFRWPWLNHAAVRLGSALLMSSATTKMPYEKLLPELRAQSATHAFGKVAKRRRRETARIGDSVRG